MNASITNSTDFLLTNETARYLGVSPQTIRVWERLGKIQALTTAGGMRLFHRGDVERLARERQSPRTGR
jgi:excisionase family DNA binding protein